MTPIAEKFSVNFDALRRCDCANAGDRGSCRLPGFLPCWA
jgi:hypothetical protein